MALTRAPAAGVRLPGLVGTLALIVGLAVVASPFFFAIERLALFDTVPRDDYAPYLLGMIGRLPYYHWQSPYGYRVLSVALAVPFFRLLPMLLPSNVPMHLTPDHARAIAALAATDFLALIAGCVGLWRLALRQGHDGLTALLAGLLLFLCGWYAQVVALDCVTLAAIVLGLWLLHDRVRFALFLLVSIVVNEKIIIVFACWLGLRCVLERRSGLSAQFACAVVAAALYLLLLKTVRLPGNSSQLTPSSFLGTMRGNLFSSLGARGLLLNVLPTALLAGLAANALRWRGDGEARAGLLLIPVLVLVGMTLTETLQIGRIVMHGAPVLLIVGSAALRRGLGAGMRGGYETGAWQNGAGPGRTMTEAGSLGSAR